MEKVNPDHHSFFLRQMQCVAVRLEIVTLPHPERDAELVVASHGGGEGAGGRVERGGGGQRGGLDGVILVQHLAPTRYCDINAQKAFVIHF